MLNTKFKSTVAFKLKGNAPMITDEELEFVTYEGMHYIATRTTPRCLIVKSTEENEQELNALRTIEDGFYVRMPTEPNFTNIEPTEIIDMDESLTYALAYYVCYLIVKTKSIVSPNAVVVADVKAEYRDAAENLITLFESNFSRGGDTLHDII